MPRLIFILLLICLPLQSFALQLGDVQLLAMSGPAAQAGYTQELHHHDDDGSVHYDVSAESIAHADEHSGSTQFSLPNSALMAFAMSLTAGADYPDPVSHVPNPCLEGPQRPPAFAPGLAAGG